MTNFSGTLWRSGGKLLCCWPQFPPPKLTCFALLLLGASQHQAVTHSDRGTSQMSPPALHVRYRNGLQAFWHQFLTPLQIPAALYVFLCLFAPCWMGMWLPDSNVLCCERFKRYCSAISSVAEMKQMPPTGILEQYGIFGAHLTSNESITQVMYLGKKFLGICDGCCWHPSQIILVFHADFGKLF